jgi:hypothetical protein
MRGNQELTTCIIVNELSNTIDLDSTLIRAEALFHRFQRRVEAIDKKQNFPKPRAQRTASSSSQTSSRETPPKDTGKAKAEDTQKAISPELRKLLSRDVEVLPRKVVQKMGDGSNADARK